MPGNTIKINKRAELEWYVGDSKMDELVKWLEKNGVKRVVEECCNDCDACMAEKKSEVINFENAIEGKSKHQLLNIWIAEFVFPGKINDFIQDVSGSGDGEGEIRWKFCFYTHEHKYTIVAHDRENDEGYLGCTASTRRPRAGEDWNRGNDLPDGPFNKKTWNRIILGILRYELEILSTYKKPDTIPEDIA